MDVTYITVLEDHLPRSFDVDRQGSLCHPYGPHTVVDPTRSKSPLCDFEAPSFSQNDVRQRYTDISVQPANERITRWTFRTRGDSV